MALIAPLSLSPNAPPEEQLRALYRLLSHEQRGVTEVRVIATSGDIKIRGIGFFDNEADFIKACLHWDKTTAHNVYVGLNPRDLALFDQAPNEVRSPNNGISAASADDITVAMFLGVDIDPIRPKGEASTETELQAALQVRDAVASWAKAQGFPPALVGMSGNGGHLIFGFPPTPPDEVTEQLRAFIQEIRTRFKDNRIAIDSTFDPPRVWKVYGTMSKKGGNTAERPWRRARIDALNPGLSEAFLEHVMHLRPPATAQPVRQAGENDAPSGEQPGLNQALEHCLFLQHAKDHAKTLSEPLWFAMVSNLVRFEGGPETIHRFSEPYPGYSLRETDAKIQHAQTSTTGPHTCQWLAENGFPCPELGRCPVKSPAGLGARLHRQAKVKEAVDGLLADMEAAFNEGTPNFLLALDRAEVLAPLNDLDYQKARAKIKTFAPKIRLPELDRLRKKFRATYLAEVVPEDAEDGASGRPRVKEVLPDAPAPAHLVLPAGWELTDTATTGTRNETNIYGEAITRHFLVCPAPLVITRRLSNLDSRHEQLSLAFSRDGAWREDTYDRETLLDHRKLTSIANSGLPVTSINAKDIVRYLADFETANMGDLPIDAVVSTLGWKEYQGRHCFVLGDQIIGAPTTSEGEPPWMRFSSESEGDAQQTAALDRRGTLEEWLEAIKQLLAFPRVMLGLYASFVPPLLPILQAPSFIIDYCGLTSQGKTTVEEIAASVWGLPSKERGGLVKSWDSTRVFAERYASLFNHLPIFLDDSQTADSRLVSRMLYMVANGVGKGRGAIKGSRRTASWSTVCFSTGEHRLIDTTEDEGARARTITLWGAPFSKDMGRFVRAMKNAVANHYGHAGPLFVQYLLKHQEEWPALRAAYEAQVQVLGQSRPGNVADRVAQYMATIRVAAQIVHDILGLGPQGIDFTVQTCFDDVLREVTRGDFAERAMQLILSWARANYASFAGAQLESVAGEDDISLPHGGGRGSLAGVWREGVYVAIFPHLVREELDHHGFRYESVLRAWAERDWIQRSADQLTYPVKFNKASQRMIVLKWAVIQAPG